MKLPGSEFTRMINAYASFPDEVARRIERSSTEDVHTPNRVEIIENDPALCIGWISACDSAYRSTRTAV